MGRGVPTAQWFPLMGLACGGFEWDLHADSTPNPCWNLENSHLAARQTLCAVLPYHSSHPTKISFLTLLHQPQRQQQSLRESNFILLPLFLGVKEREIEMRETGKQLPHLIPCLTPQSFFVSCFWYKLPWIHHKQSPFPPAAAPTRQETSSIMSKSCFTPVVSWHEAAHPPQSELMRRVKWHAIKDN